MLLPDCVYSDPDAGECADDAGTTTMSVEDAPASFERLRSTVKEVPAKDAPTHTSSAKNAKTRKILTGSVPVADLLGNGAGAGSGAKGASARTAALPAAAAAAWFRRRSPGHRRLRLR